jgi:hypothetical protein
LEACRLDRLRASARDDGGEGRVPSIATTTGRLSCWRQDALCQGLLQPLREKCRLPLAFASCGP